MFSESTFGAHLPGSQSVMSSVPAQKSTGSPALSVADAVPFSQRAANSGESRHDSENTLVCNSRRRLNLPRARVCPKRSYVRKLVAYCKKNATCYWIGSPAAPDTGERPVLLLRAICAWLRLIPIAAGSGGECRCCTVHQRGDTASALFGPPSSHRGSVAGSASAGGLQH